MCGTIGVNLFREMDADGDNRVSKKEMDAYFVAVAGEPDSTGLFEDVRSSRVTDCVVKERIH